MKLAIALKQWQHLSDAKFDLNLDTTLNSGQAFQWSKNSKNGEFIKKKV